MISMMLCVAMLIGSTFAWFTDTASTGVNKIQAGNLDMELEYWTGDVKAASLEGDDWTTVTKDTAVFKSMDGEDTQNLWEPGHTEVAYFRIKNAGNLAFDYKFGTNLMKNVLGVNEKGEEIDLTQYIKFGIVTENVSAGFSTRENAISAISGNEQSFQSTTVAGTLNKQGDTAIVAMVVYMPSTVGNEANYRGDKAPEIEFGVDVTAAQAQYENDSFGNDYDAGATFPETVYGTVVIENGSNKAMEIKGEDVSANIPAQAGLKADGEDIAEETQLILSIEPTSVDSNVAILEGDKAESYEISLKTEDGETVTASKEIELTLNIGANRNGIINLYHKEKLITSSYSKDTGILKFKVKDFSPFTIVETAANVITDAEARERLDKGGVVDFEGATLFNSTVGDNNYGANLREYTFKAGTTVKNLNLKGNSGATRWLHTDGDVTFENCTFTAPVYSCHFDSGKGSITFKNCKFTGWNAIGKTFDNIKFEKCEFYHSGRNGMVRIYTNTQFEDCIFGENMKVETGCGGVAFVLTNCTYPESVDFYQSEGSTITYQ